MARLGFPVNPVSALLAVPGGTHSEVKLRTSDGTFVAAYHFSNGLPVFGGKSQVISPFPIVDKRNQVSIFPCDRDTACDLDLSHEGATGAHIGAGVGGLQPPAWDVDGGVAVVALR